MGHTAVILVMSTGSRYKALKETEAKPGQWVAMIGACGGLGHVGCQYAKAMGLKVCAVDFGPGRRSYALETLKCAPADRASLS